VSSYSSLGCLLHSRELLTNQRLLHVDEESRVPGSGSYDSLSLNIDNVASLSAVGTISSAVGPEQNGDNFDVIIGSSHSKNVEGVDT
jgi:hypothetical protein